jgi:hypothetical protein
MQASGALGDRRRRAIVASLADRPLPVGELAAQGLAALRDRLTDHACDRQPELFAYATDPSSQLSMTGRAYVSAGLISRTCLSGASTSRLVGVEPATVLPNEVQGGESVMPESHCCSLPAKIK